MRKNEHLSWSLWVLFAYVLVTSFSLAHHEPWRDEAQAWLLVQDLPFVGMINQMGYEGTPALWHLILTPFVKSGAPYFAENIIHLLMAIAAVAIFLISAPFSRWLKPLFVFSFFVSYEYAIVARNYNITMLLLFAIAALYQSRNERPFAYTILIALLFNTNVHSALAALALALLFLVETLKTRTFEWPRFGALAIIGAGGLAALYQIRSPADNMHALSEFTLNYKSPVIAAKNALLPWSPDTVPPALFATIVFFLVCLVLYRRSLPMLFTFALANGGLFAIVIFKHSGELRHHGLLLIFMVFTLWVAYDSATSSAGRSLRIRFLDRLDADKYLHFLLLLSFAASTGVGAMAHTRELRESFSGSRSMAAYLKTNNLENRLVFAHQSAQTTGILPYFPGKKLWYADVRDSRSFITWSAEYRANAAIPGTEAVARFMDSGLDYRGKLLLLNAPLPATLDAKVRLIHKVDEKVFTPGEKLYLYEFLP